MTDTTITTTGALGEPAAVPELPPLRVPIEEQWLRTTPCRFAPSGYAWLQAVHWVAGAGIYTPSRRHGPKFGPTTIRIAKVLAELTPCRPGIRHLARRTELSERTVQYHMDMLREAGLLAYSVRGTRHRGRRAEASEFVRVIPPVFDVALGVRLAGDGPERRMVGVGEAGRRILAKLGKKASTRRTRHGGRSKATKKPSARQQKSAVEQSTPGPADTPADTVRCTPMGGGCAITCTCADTCVPHEAKLESGKHESTTAKKPQKRQRKLNRVGRRFELARELVTQVSWLSRTAVSRVAWVSRQLADDGWTVEEVVAWLGLQAPPDRRYNPAGLLARRIQSAAAIWKNPQVRAEAVEEARDSRRAARERHSGWDDGWDAPANTAARQEIERILAGELDDTGAGEDICLGDTALPVLEEMPRQQIAAARQDLRHNPEVLLATVESIAATHGRDVAESYARRLYSNYLYGWATAVLESRHLVRHGQRGWAS